MEIKEFSIEELKEFDDGRLAKAINAAFKQASRDMEDRPREKKPREVTISFKFSPRVDPDDGNQVEGVTMDFDVQCKVPKRAATGYSLGAKKGGHLYFNSNNPHQIDQMTIDDAIHQNQMREAAARNRDQQLGTEETEEFDVPPPPTAA